MTLLEQLQTLAPRAAAAASAPWHIVEDNDGVAAAYYITPQAGGYTDSEGEYNDLAAVSDPTNAAFIAAARNVLTAENLQALCAALAAEATPEFQVGDMVEIVASRERALPYGLGTLAQVKRYHYGLNEVVVKHHNFDYLTSYNADNVVVVKAKTTTMAPQWVAFTAKMPTEAGFYIVVEGPGETPFTAEFAPQYGNFLTKHCPSHWMPLPAMPAMTEGAQPNA